MEAGMRERVERVYAVEGMSCAHCVAAVSEEVGAVPGVGGVDVDLAAGRVTVRGDGFADDAVLAAVEEAGYEGRAL
jgi:copper chaperone CopZ